MEYTNLKTVIMELSTDWSVQSSETICDSLWQYYIEYHPVTDTQVKHNELALEPFLQVLSMESADNLFSLIFDLCVSYQRAAFWDGLRLGAHLMQELQ